MRLLLTGRLWPKKGYLKTTLPPSLNPGAIRHIDYDLNITKERLRYSLATKATRLYEDLNVTLKSKGTFTYATKELRSQNRLEAAYKKSRAESDFDLSWREKLRFKGRASLQNGPYPIPIKHTFYKRADIDFAGDLQKIDLNITNDKLDATATIEKLKRVRLSTRPFRLADLIEPPSQLGDLHLALEATYDQKRLKAALTSELGKIDLDYAHSTLTATARLKRYKKLRLEALNPLTITADLQKKEAEAKSPLFKARADFAKGVRADIDIPPNKIHLDYDQNLTFKAKVASLQKLLGTISKVYPLSAGDIEAAFDLAGGYDPKAQKYAFSVRSRKIRAKNRAIPVDFLQIDAHGKKDELIIDYYAIYLLNHGLYATKPSRLRFKEGAIILEPLWLMDKVKITGSYRHPKGDFSITARKFRYSSIEGILTLDANLALKIRDKDLFLEGRTLLYGGKITIEPKRQRSVSDPDIIVVDEPKPEQSSYFKEHVALNVKVEAKKPLLYTIPDLKVRFLPNLLVWKELQKELQLLGYIKILDGLYTPLGDRYEITKSELYFYGRPDDPYLDLRIRTKRQSYTIYITISGTLTNPIVSFDSDPYLPPKDILPMLLFGSSSSSLLLKATGGDRLIGALGNIFLKNFLESFGIKLDTLTLTTQGNRIGFEIGKRITDKITVIYKNDEVSTIIIRYQINDKIESEVIFGPQKSGINLFYRTIR